jgi:photosystem II stability/assembly factor-like uncharacterized protein
VRHEGLKMGGKRNMTYMLATKNGIVRADRNGETWELLDWAFVGREMTSIERVGAALLAGSREGTVRSDDGGQTWQDVLDGLDIRYVRWLGASGNRVLAGTEPAGIFYSDDHAWLSCPEVAELRDRFRWFLPYSPEAGCVRGFAFHGDRGYAAVEVGGVLRSDDAGAHWRLARGSSGEPVFGTPPAGMVHPDVHSVATHPSSPDLVFAATAGGFFRSNDGGDSWTVSHEGSYCRAFWVDSTDPDHVVLGPADDVSRNGRIEETHDGGRSWSLRSDGLDLPWPRGMIERFAQVGGHLFAMTSGGRLFVSSPSNERWQQILPDAGEIRSIAAG